MRCDIDPACREYLERLGFRLNDTHWVKVARDRKYSIAVADVNQHDLASLKYRLAELAIA